VLQNARTPEGATPASIIAEEQPSTVRVTCSDTYVLAVLALLLTAGRLLLSGILLLVVLLWLLLLLVVRGRCLLVCKLQARVLPPAAQGAAARGCSSRLGPL
jgi:hypothetical protein